MPISDTVYHGAPDSLLTQHWADTSSDAVVVKMGAGPQRLTTAGVGVLAIVNGSLVLPGPIGPLSGGGSLTNVGWDKTLKMNVATAMYWDVYGAPNANRYFGFGATNDGSFYLFHSQLEDGTTPPRYDGAIYADGELHWRSVVWSQASSVSGFFATNRNLNLDYCGLYKTGLYTYLYDSLWGNFLAFNSTGQQVDVTAPELTINRHASGNRNAILDFHGDDTYTDFGLRIIRVGQFSGANGNSTISHRGTGGFYLEGQEAGSTVQVYMSGATELSIESGKTMALRGGNRYTGIGVTWPVTASVTTNPNSLDDYEEGTWNATSGTTNVAVSNSVSGRYIKLGGFVMATCYIAVTNNTGAGITQYQINSWPFACSTAYYGGVFSQYNQGNNGVNYHNYMQAGGSYSLHYWQNTLPNGDTWYPMYTAVYMTDS